MTNVLGLDDVGVVVGDDEVDVVGSPADDKDGHHQGKHFDNLEIQKYVQKDTFTTCYPYFFFTLLDSECGCS